MKIRLMIGAVLALACIAPAEATQQGSYSMEILVDGRPLDEFRARGTTYIEALEEHEYSIRLRNRTSRRVAIALSVDGLNTIDAKTTTTGDASKWILGPHETITLDGWQVSPTDARRFFFTNEARSYGAWLGKTRDLGVISAAVFREKQKPVVRRHERYSPGKRRDSGRSAPTQAEPESAGAREMKSSEPAPSDDYAATGIGNKINHRVNRIRFEAEPEPAAVLELRYEFHDALVRLGVLPERYSRGEDTLLRRERAHGFKDMRFAPDPFDR